MPCLTSVLMEAPLFEGVRPTLGTLGTTLSTELTNASRSPKDSRDAGLKLTFRCSLEDSQKRLSASPHHQLLDLIANQSFWLDEKLHLAWHML